LDLLLISIGKRLLIFFALVSADLAIFSGATLATFAPSQASLEALSSGSRADMQELTTVKATTIQKKKKERQ
jgi:hypothetical protein